jgi:polyisoprenoid-binding protein YceI
MKTKKYLFIIAIATLGLTLNGQTFKANVEKSTLSWSAKKVTGEHHGNIKLKDGQFTLTKDRITSGSFQIDMTTISNVDLTDAEWNAKLIGHLKSDDFFSVEKNPVATLKISGSTAFKNNEATVSGTLTIKGIEAPITFVVKKEGSDYFSIITVDRTKYDIKYGSGKYFEGLGDKMIYDEFTLEVKIVVS